MESETFREFLSAFNKDSDVKPNESFGKDFYNVEMEKEHFDTASILIGPLEFGPRFNYKGSHELGEICLYGNNSSDASELVEVIYSVKSIAPIASIRPSTYTQHRKRLHLTDDNIIDFFKSIFNYKSLNKVGQTTHCILIEIEELNEDIFNKNFNPAKARAIIYGEKIPNSHSIDLYAHFIHTYNDFIPCNYQVNYLMPDKPRNDDTTDYGTSEGAKDITAIDELDQLSDETIQALAYYDNGQGDSVHQNIEHMPLNHDYERNKKALDEMFALSTHIPASRVTPIDEKKMFELICEDISKKNRKHIPNVLIEAANAHKKPKRAKHTTEKSPPITIPSKTDTKTTNHESSQMSSPQTPLTTIKANKPKSSKTRPDKATINERKETIRNAVRAEITRQDLDSTKNHLYQQICAGVRYSYRHLLTGVDELDIKKLELVVKMHTDFIISMDKIVDL